MKNWIKSWKSSVKPSKQHRYGYNAPLHIKHKFLSANLSKELREKYKLRNISIKTGDKVKVLRGQYRKRTGNVTNINLKQTKIYVEGIENIRKDGTKSFYPIHPSNLQIIELNLQDKRRKLNTK
jgi:large subunit ribosomal protein L24|tara:strand:- start:10215 stop:10586 length:372 start_codon:yes stop_codon:yes gene_type:complete